MKIGINVSFLSKPMTGIGQVTANFLRELVEFSISHSQFPNNDQKPKAQQAEFILYCQEEPKPDFELPENFKIKVFLPWWKRDDVIRQWLWERQLAREAVEDGCEVFFSLYQSATVFNPQPTTHNRQPITHNLSPRMVRHVMLVHDLIPKIFPEYVDKWSNRLHYRAILRGIRAATHVITPSVATKHDIEATLGRAATDITPIALGVEERFFQKLGEHGMQEVLERYQLTPGYLYHGGGLEIRKNTEAVLRAYARLVHNHVPNVPPLVISGKVHAESNPLATPVKRLIEELGLGERVKLLGLVPTVDLPALYQGARMFLFPSRYEGFGLPVAEAFASGTPVITTTAGSLAELVGDGAALTVTVGPEMDEAVARAIDTLLGDPTLCDRLRQRGRERLQGMSWSAFTKRVMQLLLQ